MSQETSYYQGNKKILFMTTFAFFITFMLWFNMSPFTAVIQEQLQLTNEEISLLMMVNVAIAIPARMLIGVFVDRYGAKNVFTLLLVLASIPCFMFALGNNFVQLFVARGLLALVGAGFVVGIRLISEWFPSHQIGLAEGIYGGWGNFGSAGASLLLPVIAYWLGGEHGWRMAVAVTGVLAVVYAVIFYRFVKNSPGNEQKPSKKKSLEVATVKDFISLSVMILPIYGVFIIIGWNLFEVKDFPFFIVMGLTLILLAAYASHVRRIWKRNRTQLLSSQNNQGYLFPKVTILSFAYFITFGCELALISMLPLYYGNMFELDVVTAGFVAGTFPFMNLVSRPLGGWLSDRFGRKRVLLFLLAMLTIGYIGMSQMTSQWPLGVAILLTVLCACVSQSASGAVFSMVPLVKKEMTGQVAGIVGAFGNLGGVFFLTVFSFAGPVFLFFAISLAGVICFISSFFFDKERHVRLQESDYSGRSA